MEMIKNSSVRRIAPIVLIMYLPVRDFFFSISKITYINMIPHLQSSTSNSFTSFYQSFIYAKPSYLFIFFTFNVLLVAVLIGFYAHLSNSASPSSSSPPPPTDSYGPNSDHESIPEMFYVDYGNGSDMYFKSEEITEEDEKNECVPGIVHVNDVESLNKEEEMEREHEDGIVEYLNKEGEMEREHEDGIVVYDHEEYGYEDDDAEDGYSESDDIDLNKRIEEFIGVNNKKWREELHNDSLMLSSSDALS